MLQGSKRLSNFAAPSTDLSSRLLPTATGLLVSLTNPLNITLITSQLLSASSLWDGIQDLRACTRIFSVFYTAALQLSERSASDARVGYSPAPLIEKARWATAVVKGADDKSPRWRHALILGAILLGFEEKQKQSLPPHLRSRLESALLTATNLALEVSDRSGNIGKFAIAFVLVHSFGLLSAHNQAQFNYDFILPLLIETTFSSPEGLEHGYWLGAIDSEVIEVTDRKFNWSARSNTYHHILEMQQRPLVASLGSMSRLIAYAIRTVHNSALLLPTLDCVAEFARTLWLSWRQNKLSEIDVSEELEYLDAESTKTTLPTLWHLLRLSLFAIVIILRALMGRLLSDPILASDSKAPFLAMQCLLILRNLYFISSRLGQTSSSQYVFVNMAAIDVLTQYPEQAESFIQSIKPVGKGLIPSHPADRCLDLFFFNTTEHFTPSLVPKTNEDIVLAGAMPYLVTGGSKFLMETFEAAHSVALSVLASPNNAELTARQLPFYLDALFNCFPDSLSPRQFRLAFKTIVRISSPPSALAQSQPLLPSIILETIFERAERAPTTPLPQVMLKPELIKQEISLSEQAVFVMAMIDSLCFLHPALLEEWLPVTASLVAQIEEEEMRRACQDRFWEAISSGEMDVERAALCVAWWGSRGGRELILQNDAVLQIEPVMSGALSMESKL